MKQMAIVLTILLFSFSTFSNEISEPIAEKIPTKLTKHKHTRIDNYYWMKEKENPKVIDHLRQENAYTEAMMKGTQSLQEKLFKEMKSRIKEEDTSWPIKEKNFFYYSKMIKDKEHPLHYRKKNLADKKEELILDENELAKDKSFISVSALEFHPDENLLAYALDTKGDRIYTIYFKDIKEGKLLDQKIEDVTGNFVWAETGKVLFYTKQDAQTLRSDKVYRYNLETNENTLMYTEKDELFETLVYKTITNNFIMIHNASISSSETLYISAKNPNDKFKTFNKRQKDILYSVYDGEDKFYILTNFKAKNFRVMATGLDKTVQKNWKDVIAHNPDIFITSLRVFKKFLVTEESINGQAQIHVFKKGEKTGDYIKFPDPAYTVALYHNEEFDTQILNYFFMSMNRPYSIFEYNLVTKESVVRKEKEVPGYNYKDYISERVFAKAQDGTMIPISLIYKKGFKKDGSNPLFVYGYGSYGMNTDPFFSANLVSLYDRGFVFAIIHARGGAEMGRKWYEDGKFLKKKNTFTDFISATDFLIEQKYGNPKKVFAEGGSAGGLLMGAIMNMRPELYNGVIAEVPFVDVVTTMLDDSLPLTTGEYEEWGNPNQKKFYDYMLSYSPYDNVGAKNYPNLLVTTGLNDSQVSYWEPAKWVAKLREMRTDKSKLLLFKTEMEVGHGGKSGRYEYLHNEGLKMAFLIQLAEKK